MAIMENEAYSGKPVNSPEDQVREIWQEVQVLGGNDFEPGAFQTILERLKSGALSGEEAVHEARVIKDRKEDYH